MVNGSGRYIVLERQEIGGVDRETGGDCITNPPRVKTWTI